MGSIIARTKEHLGHTDAMIIQMRRRLLRSAMALQQTGQSLREVDDPEMVKAMLQGLALAMGGTVK